MATVAPKWEVQLPSESAALSASSGVDAAQAPPRLRIVVSYHQEPLERVVSDVARMLEVPNIKDLSPQVHVYVKGGPAGPVQAAMPWAHAVEPLQNVGRAAHVSICIWVGAWLHAR